MLEGLGSLGEAFGRIGAWARPPHRPRRGLWEVLPVFRMRKEVQAARAWPLETDEAVVKMAGEGRTEAVEALVRKCGASPDAVNEAGTSAVAAAAEGGHTSTVEALVRLGAGAP